MNGPKNEKDAIKEQIVLRFWPVGVVFFCIFIPVSFFVSADYASGWFLLGTFIFFILGMLIYWKTRNVTLISNTLAMLGIPVLLPWLVTGGPANSGFWWSVVYVVWAFSVTSQKSAVFWLSAHVIVSAVMALLAHQGLVKIAYAIPELLNILFAFVVTLTLVFLFNRVLVYYLQLAHQRAELVAVNRELVSENKELVSENRELEQFAYVASHDLQEPLRNITNFVGLLEKRLGQGMNEDTTYLLSVITKSADRMRILIRDLLNFSKIGKETKKEKINCNQLLNEVLADMAEIIKESGADIRVEELPEISGNRTELKQLFQNFLSNAIKFRKSGTQPEVRVRCEITKSHWKFSVSDNGIGIEKEHQKKIFLIFQRLHSETEYPGTGIGLAICRKVVETMAGKIGVSAKPGVGSIFFFSIPRK